MPQRGNIPLQTDILMLHIITSSLEQKVLRLLQNYGSTFGSMPMFAYTPGNGSHVMAREAQFPTLLQRHCIAVYRSYHFLHTKIGSRTLHLLILIIHIQSHLLQISTVQCCVKTFLLSFKIHPQNGPLPTPKMHYGAILQPAIPKTCQKCFYTTL